MKHIAIIGSRTFNNYELLQETLLRYSRPFIVVSGGAKGADALGERFAGEYGLDKKVYPADWNTHGRRAGFIRNDTIIQNADIVIAFWDGRSKGTKDSINKAIQKRRHITIIFFS